MSILKSKYDDFVKPRLEEIEAWCRDGLSDKDIAHNLGVAYSTFKSYKGVHPDLSAVLVRGKSYVDNVIVTNAYLRRITGYDTIERRTEFAVMTDPDTGKRTKVAVKEIEQTRHIPGDARAAEFWLTNRQPDKWKHRPDAEAADKDDSTGVIMMPEVKSGG